MDQFEKAKTAKTNENTSISEEAKVRHADKTKAIVSSRQKIELREEKGSVTSVKIWELDSNNRDIDKELLWLFRYPRIVGLIETNWNITHAKLATHSCSALSVLFVFFPQPF